MENIKEIEAMIKPYIGKKIWLNGKRGTLIHRDGVFYKLSIHGMLTPNILFYLDEVNGCGLFKYRLSADPQLCMRTIRMETCRWDGDAWNSGTPWVQ